MPLQKEVYAFDIDNWRGKNLQEIISDSSSGTIEATRGPLLKRVNPVSIKLSSFAKWSDENSQDPVIIASTMIYSWAINNNSKGIEVWLPSKNPEENEILEAIKPFSDFNPGRVLVWFSPRNDTTFKEGTRIGIYQVIYVNNEKYLFFRTLCSFDYGYKCANYASGLLPYSSVKENSATLADTEILRATPLPLEIPGNSLCSFLENHLNFPSVFWQALSKGKDIDEKIKINKLIEQIYTPEIIEEIERAQSFTAQLKIGRYLEREFQERTGRTLGGGVCGPLYSSLEGNNPISVILGIGNTEGRGRRHCGKCLDENGSKLTAEFKPGETCKAK